MSYYTRNRTPINTAIVALGVDTYLGMLLKHNFVHTDLHPGGSCGAAWVHACKCARLHVRIVRGECVCLTQAWG